MHTVVSLGEVLLDVFKFGVAKAVPVAARRRVALCGHAVMLCCQLCLLDSCSWQLWQAPPVRLCMGLK